jgi:hypothetical protein
VDETQGFPVGRREIIMAATQPPVIGVFATRVQAEEAVQELRQAGFWPDQIGVVVRHGETLKTTPVVEGDTTPEEGASVGALSGGIIGAFLGAAVALAIPGIGPALAVGTLAGVLAGATIGVAGGGLIGGLIGLGFSEEEAKHYEQEFRSGRILVTVRADGRQTEAATILIHEPIEAVPCSNKKEPLRC